ncbi:MauE/DoxX family redox-associated membrane protein [Rothia sp. P13129]|uniref:MauE/DoxX family redox-associated membrane protein n=1 Tax=Rothia sp. P13129 TaxID=3402664 RepID=UPI003ACA3BC2
MTPLVLCSLTVVAVLVISGIAKAKEPQSTATALVNLKLDSWLPLKFIAKTLPWVELFLAAWILVVPGPIGALGAFVAVILFAVYWVVIARAVVTGNTASCQCFGSGSQAPISVFTLGRNTALFGAAMGALVGAVQTGNSALVQFFSLNSEGWLWIFSAVVLSSTLWFIYRSENVPASPTVGRSDSLEDSSALESYLQEYDGVEAEYVRLPIPFGTLENSDGFQVNVREFASSQARILLWVSPGCGPCQGLLEQIDDWQEQLLPLVKIHPIVSEHDLIPYLGLSDTFEPLVDPQHQFQPAFGWGSPMAVALGADGLVAGGPVRGQQDIEQFFADIIAQLAEPAEEEDEAVSATDDVLESVADKDS